MLLSILSALASGLLFGAGLVISGMINPQKVIGFLDIFGHWDPSLALVMTGALAVYTPAYWLLVRQRTNAVLSEQLHIPNRTEIDCQLLIGAILFGVGWGLVGICPGPALTLISSLQQPVFLFIAAMFVGFWLAPKWMSLMGKSVPS
ncbi:DUF6691 family protein [Neiella marina]|nr:DUF6691 family protein [Neiella marina]